MLRIYNSNGMILGQNSRDNMVLEAQTLRVAESLSTAKKKLGFVRGLEKYARFVSAEFFRLRSTMCKRKTYPRDVIGDVRSDVFQVATSKNAFEKVQRQLWKFCCWLRHFRTLQRWNECVFGVGGSKSSEKVSMGLCALPLLLLG